MLIKFRVVSSIDLQNVMVRQLPKQELLSNFKIYSKRSTAFVYSLSVTFFGCSRRFEKAFGAAGEPDVQDYAPAQNISTANFLYITYYVENADILFCCVTHYTNYII